MDVPRCFDRLQRRCFPSHRPDRHTSATSKKTLLHAGSISPLLAAVQAWPTPQRPSLQLCGSPACIVAFQLGILQHMGYTYYESLTLHSIQGIRFEHAKAACLESLCVASTQKQRPEEFISRCSYFFKLLQFHSGFWRFSARLRSGVGKPTFRAPQQQSARPLHRHSFSSFTRFREACQEHCYQSPGIALAGDQILIDTAAAQRTPLCLQQWVCMWEPVMSVAFRPSVC